MSYLGRSDELDIEYRRITRKLDTLYAAQMDGDNSLYTRQRIRRGEALQAVLMGSPEALSGE